MMSGYRRMDGRELKPTTPDIELGRGALSMPSIPPLAIMGQFGLDYQEVGRRGSDGTTATRKASSFDVNEVELIAGTPLGKNLSFFLDYELFETEVESRTGPGEANETGRRHNFQFETEGPRAPGLAMVIWNSLLPQSVAPLDILNIIGGIKELPLAFSPHHRRLSASPYLIYERRGLDLVSGMPLEDLLSAAERRQLLRFSKSQIGVELNGNIRTGATPEAFSLRYNVGVTNGSNNSDADPNTEKDFFGRLGATWAGQGLGIFGYWSPDIYDDNLRRNRSIAAGGILAGPGRNNEASGVGPDLTLSLEPLDIPIWLETQFLFNNETSPTGFYKSFGWWGGFSQLNWMVVRSLLAYGRYDWLRGDRFDDTALGGNTGPVKPREWAATFGLQWYALENLKLLAEYNRHEFENTASTPRKQKINEDFFTLRVSLGF
jgi:hypothetical protein